MKRFTLITLLIAVAALAIGCGAQVGNVFSRVDDGLAGASAPAPPSVEYDTSAVPGRVPNQPKAQELPTQAASGDANQNQAQDTRMIVYTGSVALQVNDTAETITKIQELLKNVNGYIATKNVVAYGKDKLRGTINIRVPAAALDSTIAQIKALGVKVLKETADSNDVTSEYVDLDARRKNLEVYEVQLQDLLETVRERTGKAEDILAVYNQLTQVRGEIEQIKGRQNYLQNTSALATYTIELVPIEEIIVEGKPGWDPSRTAGSALDRLVGTLQGLGDIAINFVLFVLPVLLILVLPVLVFIWIVRTVVKRRTPKKSAAANQ